MRTWHWILVSLAAVLSVGSEFAATHHADHWWNSIPAFYALLGFIGCTAIIFIAKLFGKWFLEKQESYYDAD